MKWKMWKVERPGHEEKKTLFDRLEAAALKKHRNKRNKRNKKAKESRRNNRRVK